jgi:HSP20 family protein
MKMESVKQNFESMWDSVTEGWRHLWQSAGTSLTHFKPGQDSSVPAKSEVDDSTYLPGLGWSMLGGDVFEDDERVMARLEVPGMEKDDITIEVLDNRLIVSGEKRFERENSDGRWRVVQCAYGAFRREIALPAKVLVEQASATYKNGVLRVEIPKAELGQTKPHTIKVD